MEAKLSDRAAALWTLESEKYFNMCEMSHVCSQAPNRLGPKASILQHLGRWERSAFSRFILSSGRGGLSGLTSAAELPRCLAGTCGLGWKPWGHDISQSALTTEGPQLNEDPFAASSRKAW